MPPEAHSRGCAMSEEHKSRTSKYRWLLPTAVIAVMLAVGLPLLYVKANRPHVPAPWSATNLDSIYNSMYTWSTKHEDRFPANFGPLLKSEDFPMDWGLLINPRLSSSPWPPPASSASAEQVVRWASNNAHYVLITPNDGLDHPDDQPLMYERLHPDLKGGIFICFGDGHVKFVRWPRAVELLKQAGEPIPNWARQRAEEMNGGS